MEQLDKVFQREETLQSDTMNEIVGKINELVQESDNHISDAPTDGKTYGRNNGQWAEIVGGEGGSLVIDAELSETSTNPVQILTQKGLCFIERYAQLTEVLYTTKGKVQSLNPQTEQNIKLLYQMTEL